MGSLLDRGLQSITGEEAMQMVKDQGAVIVDVNKENKFKGRTIEGAINVPFFRPLTGDSMLNRTKRFWGNLLGVEATERNPDFASLARERLPSNRPVIVACDRGGLVEMPKIK